MTAPQSLRCALQAVLDQVAQPLVRHKQYPGLFVSGLGPHGAPPPIGPANPSLGRSSMGLSLRLPMGCFR